MSSAEENVTVASNLFQGLKIEFLHTVYTLYMYFHYSTLLLFYLKRYFRFC